MKTVALICMLSVGCAHAPPTSVQVEPEEQEQGIDLGRLIASILNTKEKVVIKQQSKRVIQLCKSRTPGAFDDSALEEAMRVIVANKAIMEECANNQLKDIAKEFNLEIRE